LGSPTRPHIEKYERRMRANCAQALEPKALWGSRPVLHSRSSRLVLKTSTNRITGASRRARGAGSLTDASSYCGLTGSYRGGILTGAARIAPRAVAFPTGSGSDVFCPLVCGFASFEGGEIGPTTMAMGKPPD
jgi:hypothetical protein